MEPQTGNQFAVNGSGTRLVEQVRTIGTQRRRQGTRHPHRLPAFFRRFARQTSGKVGQRRASAGETLFANVERHQCVTVGGDDPRPGGNVRLVDPGDILGRLQQGQCRPFRLAERCTDALELSPHAAIE
ncbi:hypothetical protein D9M71_46900 [compost metagenome]